MKNKTEQEEFWSGEFGDEYISRNKSNKTLSANIATFSQILKGASNIESVIEFGSNIGLNINALKVLLPDAELTAIEINKKAVEKLQKIDNIDVIHSSILDAKINRKFDMTLIKGVLIHINPSDLQETYQKLYDLSEEYICVVEYYNPYPIDIDYRGHDQKLYKRDFAGEIMDKFDDVQLIDYGFLYHKDNNFEHDDSTWFLLRKQ